MATAKAYNALTMDEFRAVVLKEIEQSLIDKGFSGVATTLPAAKWEWSLKVYAERDPSEVKVERRHIYGSDEHLPKEAKTMIGGSWRFTKDKAEPLEKRSSPSPTEVREDAGLKKPEL